MDEDVAIINTNTRSEKIKNFFIKNKNKLILIVLVVILVFVGFFGYSEYKNKEKIEISNEFNTVIIKYSEANKEATLRKLVNIVNKEDPTYSPLSLYFIIDNRLISDQTKINNLFDILINKTSLEKEIKNLIIYKKGLYNADQTDENSLLKILNPLINSKSIWRSHALYLMAEFFYSNNEKEKSKDFFQKILTIENANTNIIREAQKRISRDLSE